MQLLWGINHHLLTSYADPLKAGGNLKILWMVAGREKKEEESEKKKSLRIRAASSLMGRLWGLYELTINSLCRFPEWGIETNCLLAIQACCWTKRKKRWLWRRLTRKAVFETFHFSLCRHKPYGKTPTHSAKWPFQKARDLPKTEPLFKIVILQQLLLLQAI